MLENLGLEGGVSDLAVDLVDDSLGESLLLFLADLGLVSDPRVKNRLGLVGKSNLLLKLESLRLKLDSLLGDSEEVLGDAHDILDLGDTLDSLLDGKSVGVTGLVEDVLDILNVTLGPLLVGGSDSLGDDKEEDTEDGSNASLGIDNVETVGDGEDTGSSERGEDASLGDNVVTGEGSKDGRGLGLGLSLRRVEADEGTKNKKKKKSKQGENWITRTKLNFHPTTKINV